MQRDQSRGKTREGREDKRDGSLLTRNGGAIFEDEMKEEEDLILFLDTTIEREGRRAGGRGYRVRSDKV